MGASRGAGLDLGDGYPVGRGAKLKAVRMAFPFHPRRRVLSKGALRITRQGILCNHGKRNGNRCPVGR